MFKTFRSPSVALMNILNDLNGGGDSTRIFPRAQHWAWQREIGRGRPGPVLRGRNRFCCVQCACTIRPALEIAMSFQ